MGISAVISDIHSNLHALGAVMDQIDDHGCDEILCLGDIAGYGAQPVEVIGLIRERGALCIQGNHDSLITLQNEGLNYSSVSLIAAEHNRRLLGRSELEFLANLPLEMEGQQRSLLIHGSPDYQDTYLINEAQIGVAALEVHDRLGPGLCFFGHTHVPTFHDGRSRIFNPGETYRCDSDVRIMVNPGSVGQPRDGDPRASYVLWDRDRNTVRLMKAEYDVEGARRTILAAGLPEILGDRLLRGH
jgi:predicted phosphodiesterase